MKFVIGILALCIVFGCAEKTKIEESSQTTEAENVNKIKSEETLQKAEAEQSEEESIKKVVQSFETIESLEEFHADLKEMYSKGEYDAIKTKYGEQIRNAMLEMIKEHHKDELERMSKGKLEVTKDNTIRIKNCILNVGDLKISAEFMYGDDSTFFSWTYNGHLGVVENKLVVQDVTEMHAHGVMSDD